MNIKEKKELTMLLSRMVDGLKSTVDNQKMFTALFDKITDILGSLIKKMEIIFFILNLLIWRIFLWELIDALFNKIIIKWSLLTEGYKILILGFIGTIIAGIIAQVVGSLFFEKIKNILKDKK